MEHVNLAWPVTSEPLFHWFGYYDMPCWDRRGRYLLSLGVPFEDRPPRADDVAIIGISDQETGRYQAISQTRAFNWQQGAMMNWLLQAPGQQIVFNDRLKDRHVSIIMDVVSGKRRVLGRALSDVGQRGGLALGLNFARIAQTRPGYGYAGLPDSHAADDHPDGDGVFVVDLSTGQSTLAVSMRQVYEYLGWGELDGVKMWFNHTLLNPSETSLVPGAVVSGAQVGVEDSYVLGQARWFGSQTALE